MLLFESNIKVLYVYEMLENVDGSYNEYVSNMNLNLWLYFLVKNCQFVSILM